MGAMDEGKILGLRKQFQVATSKKRCSGGGFGRTRLPTPTPGGRRNKRPVPKGGKFVQIGRHKRAGEGKGGVEVFYDPLFNIDVVKFRSKSLKRSTIKIVGFICC